ncbi:MAG: alkaline phosphatase family protein [Candidatus Baltobacteraceae bacterium]
MHSISHVIILVQENRSFDNLFMGFPGADTVTSGPCAPAPWCKGGQKVPLKQITLESTGNPNFGKDIDHSHRAFEVEYNNGKMDGFDKIRFGAGGQGTPAKLYPYAFIERSETKPYWDLASSYAIADKMFFTATASSFIAHQQIIAGTTQLNANESLTDQPDNTPWGCDAPPGTVSAIIKTNGQVDEFGGPFPCFTQYGTMADLLDAASVSWKYYVSAFSGKDADFSGAVWNGFDAIKKVRYGADWKTHISEPNTNVLSDVRGGKLPAVSWVIPTLFDSDHPASGCNHGPQWVSSVIDAVGKSKYWNSTAIVLLWDDWGGFYDNAKPPQIDYTSLGFRVPMVVISPFVKPHFVSHTQYDFGSILKFLEENFGLGSLGTSDAGATSMDDMFDFNQQPNAFHPPSPAHVTPCTGSATPQEIIEKDGGVPE